MSDPPLPKSPSRRRFVSTGAATVAAGSLSQLAFAGTNQAITSVAPAPSDNPNAVRPLHVHVPEEQLGYIRVTHKPQTTNLRAGVRTSSGAPRIK